MLGDLLIVAEGLSSTELDMLIRLTTSNRSERLQVAGRSLGRQTDCPSEFVLRVTCSQCGDVLTTQQHYTYIIQKEYNIK